MPTITDASLQGWFLFPARPSLVLPMMLIAPDDRTLAHRPAEQLPRTGRARWRAALRMRLARRPRRRCPQASPPSWRCGARAPPRAALARVGRRAAARATAPRAPGRYDDDLGAAPVVLDRQRRRLLVQDRARPHDAPRRSSPPSTISRARGVPFSDGAARLVVVPAPGAAPVRHRRVGRAADGPDAVGAARRRAARRHRRAARGARRPAARRALPPPVVGVAVPRRVRLLGRRRARAPEGPGAVRAVARPVRRRGASRRSSTTG